MKKYLLYILSSMLLLSGCAKNNIELSESYWQTPNQKILVAYEKQPKPHLYKEGRQGIIDYTINTITSDDFAGHIMKSKGGHIAEEAKLFERKLKAKGFHTTHVAEAIDINQLPKDPYRTVRNRAERIFATLDKKHKHDQLLLLSVDNIGATRQYYGFIPLGAPLALCTVEGKLIDLKTNEIIWKKVISVKERIARPWDQSPNYPNFDKALNVAIAKAKKSLEKSFFHA